MPQPVTATHLQTGGRNRRLVAIRNHRMICRYYFWREIERRRSDDVITILSRNEFFLEEITVRRIIRDQLDYFTELRKSQPSEKKLQQIIQEYQDIRYEQTSLFD